MSSSPDLNLIHKTKSINMKPFLLLKDYLKDDFSSCSSNGFKSFPRKQQQQCCSTSVRFLIDLDLQRITSDHLNKKKTTKNSRFFTTSRSISVLQRASRVLLSAVKLLPFSTTSLGSTTSNNNNKSSSSCSKKGGLTKSFSQKLLKRTFWKKSKDGEVQRWRSFSEFLDEKDLQQIPCDTTITIGGGGTSLSDDTTTSTSNNSCLGSSELSWASECLQQVSSSSSRDFNNHIDSPEKKKSCTMESREEATTTSYSIEPNAKKIQKERPTKEEKEQFSPVSVLEDCPFDDHDEEDEDEETCPPFRHHRLAQLEGKAKKLKKKLRRFENLTDLEPIQLEKKMTLSTIDTTTSMFISIENEVKKGEEDLLINIIKTRIPSNSLFKLKANEMLLIDLFKESIEELWEEGDAMKVAEDWASGKPNEVILDWQVREGRQVYIRDMEERGQWRMMNNEDDDRQRVRFEIENGVWSFLLDELVHDLCAYQFIL